MALLQQLIQHPKKMFLIDGIGALLSALGLLFILIPFETYFGMPAIVCQYLSFIAFAFTAFSLMRYFSDMNNWHTYLKVIATANSLYCLLTLGLVIKYVQSLSALGIAYFVGEMLIILAIVRLEIAVIKKHQ